MVHPAVPQAREPSGFLSVGDLPDVNVWLALVFRGHLHHGAAMAYWESRPQRVVFSRVTMLGLVRLVSQPRVMGEGALDPRRALDVYHDLISREGVALHPEPAGCDVTLSEFTSPDLPARMMTDAYLAAFARSGRLRLVTFDRDFDRFNGLDLLKLHP